MSAEEPTLDEIRHRLLVEIPRLQLEHSVKSLEVFGSWVRDENSESSDLDLLVEFDETPTLFGLVRLENELSAIAGIQVDLVMKTGLKPTLRSRILQEAIPINE